MGDATVSVSVPKLGSSNWAVWQLRARQALTIKGCWQAVEQDNHAESAKALAFIGAWVEDYHLPTWQACATAKEAWDKFSAMYASSSAAHLLQLRQQLFSLKKEHNESVERYVARARALQNQLAAAGGALARPAPAAAAAAAPGGAPAAAAAPAAGGVTEQDVVQAVIAGLPSEFSTLITVLQATKGMALTLDELTAAAIIEEAKYPTSLEPAGDKALAAVGPTCWYCDKPGHIKKDCHKRKTDLRRAGEGAQDKVPCLVMAI